MSLLADDEDARIKKAFQQLCALLVPNETVDAFAVQRRIFALDHRRTIVAATSGRFLGVRRHLLGGFEPQTIRWQDLKDIRLQVGTFGADLTLVALTSPDLAVTSATQTSVYSGLRKTQAEAVYRLCQANEQAWREKRRIRELEEMRAQSGGIQLGAAQGRPEGGAPASDEALDPVKKLERAREMLAKGLISDSEYESLKARIISSM
ncbi:MAG: SHOCT domain-containing protein [Pseudomonadota bacterium]|nr:SHOCT domain-containing protein [Pseudomonadota bacterium]